MQNKSPVARNPIFIFQRAPGKEPLWKKHERLLRERLLQTKYSEPGERQNITSFPCILATLRQDTACNKAGKYPHPVLLQYLPIGGQGAGQPQRSGSEGSPTLSELNFVAGGGWMGLQQWLKNRLWKERLTC